MISKDGINISPVTAASTVIVNANTSQGSEKNLQEMIDNGEFVTSENLRQTVESILSEDVYKELVEYKGEFDYSQYTTRPFRSLATKGDWWIYTGIEQLNIDNHAVLNQNGIVWFDGTYFNTIYIPYQNNILPKDYYDIIIVGGGAAGIGLAYAIRDYLKSENARPYKVALVERLDTLGGTHCNGVGLYLPSPSTAWLKNLITECYHEGIMTVKGRYQSPLYGVGEGTTLEKAIRASMFCDSYGSKINGFKGNFITNNNYKLAQKYFADLSPYMDIFINTEIVRTNSSDGAIYSITVKNIIKNEEFELCADYFADCTGNGDVFVLDEKLKLDEDYYIGADPADRFNETGRGMYPAGYQGDHSAINTVEVMWWKANRKYNAGYAFPPLPEYYKKYSNLSARSNFEYIPLNNREQGLAAISNSYGTGVIPQQFIDRTNNWMLGDGANRALAYFIEKSGYIAANRYAGITKMLAIREKYRVKAEFMMDASWLMKQVTSDNYQADEIISLSTWYPDIHTPGQNYSPNYTIANGIPWKSLIASAYSNLLVPCKAFGVSHLAASSMRLVITLLETGHSAGVGLLQLLNNDTRGDVRTVNVAEVQQQIGIADTISELETHFYGPTVAFEELQPSNDNQLATP